MINNTTSVYRHLRMKIARDCSCRGSHRVPQQKQICFVCYLHLLIRFAASGMIAAESIGLQVARSDLNFAFIMFVCFLRPNKIGVFVFALHMYLKINLQIKYM